MFVARFNAHSLKHQGIGDNKKRAYGHGRHTNNGVEQPHDGNRDGYQIIEKSPEKILFDFPEGVT